jgi:hypothetical protein
MCAKCVEELLVYQKALDAADEISAILSGLAWRQIYAFAGSLVRRQNASPL